MQGNNHKERGGREMKRAILILLTVCLLSGCCTYDVDEILLQKSDISLTWKGTDQFVYDPLTCQLSHNSSTHEYRIFDDKIANWFIVRCSERPDTEGQQIRADVTWTTSNGTKNENNVEFTVKQTDANGQIWLWNKKKSIGIVIKNL